MFWQDWENEMRKLEYFKDRTIAETKSRRDFLKRGLIKLIGTVYYLFKPKQNYRPIIPGLESLVPGLDKDKDTRKRYEEYHKELLK